MADFCLLKHQIDKFKQDVDSGKINPVDLMKLSSEKRREFLEQYVGANNAKSVNALFESKLMLKNQKQGLINWVKKIPDSSIKPKYKKDIIDKIAGIKKALDPDELDMYLQDFAEQKLGVGVTQQEGKTLVELSNRISDAEAKATDTLDEAYKSGYTMSEANREYGRAQYDMIDYLSELKKDTEKMTLKDWQGKNIMYIPAKIGKAVADVSKSLGASFDNSFLGRQGQKMFMTNNAIWRQEAVKSFKNIIASLKNPKVARREFMAELMGDPVYKQAIKDGLALGRRDDVFTTSLPGKVPILGRGFSASELAYDGLAQNMRMKAYKKVVTKELEKMNKKGAEVPKDFSKNIATMVNSLTGRGHLGKFEPASGKINLAFYSLRFLQSNVDTLLRHPLGYGVGGMGSAAQKEAARNLLKIALGTATILKTAEILLPGSVEWDTRSSDFGKIKYKDTRFDVTGGMGNLVVLLARSLPYVGEQGFGWYSKGANTGITTKIKAGSVSKEDKLNYDAKSLLDIYIDFFGNKLSPIGSVAKDWMTGEEFGGTTPTVESSIKKLTMPITIGNYIDAKDNPNSAPILTSTILDALGIGANTYSASGQGSRGTNWEINPTTKTKAFQAKVGNDTFKKASKEADDTYNKWISAQLKNPKYKSYSSEEKSKVITAKRNEIQSDIFKKYGFKYKPQKEGKTGSQLLDALNNR